MKRFSPKEQIILQSMYRHGVPLTLYELIKVAGLARATIKTHAENLIRKGIIITIKKNSKTYLRINPDLEP